VVFDNIHFTVRSYDHYDFPEMKKTPCGISPIIAIRFVELTPHNKNRPAIPFGSVDPAFSGEMTMVVTFEDRDGETEVTILFEHLPSGIRPEENDAGTRSSLENLGRYIEHESGKSK
jgi:hypothetical protein